MFILLQHVLTLLIVWQCHNVFSCPNISIRSIITKTLLSIRYKQLVFFKKCPTIVVVVFFGECGDTVQTYKLLSSSFFSSIVSLIVVTNPYRCISVFGAMFPTKQPLLLRLFLLATTKRTLDVFFTLFWLSRQSAKCRSVHRLICGRGR